MRRVTLVLAMTLGICWQWKYNPFPVSNGFQIYGWKDALIICIFLLGGYLEVRRRMKIARLPEDVRINFAIFERTSVGGKVRILGFGLGLFSLPFFLIDKVFSPVTLATIFSFWFLTYPETNEFPMFLERGKTTNSENTKTDSIDKGDQGKTVRRISKWEIQFGFQIVLLLWLQVLQ